MAGKRPTTIARYIKAAPREGQPHLRKLHAILKRAAPKAEEKIKWGQPFFVDPRFVFAFSAHKAHLSFAPTPEALAKFRSEVKKHDSTRNFLKIRYDEPLPEKLLRKIAAYRVRQLRERKGEAFW
jgi:uncharacterized protein YdhG (YjbR/CyaY superfamily)